MVRGVKTLLYIRGEPGSGKHTVGRLVAAALGWPMLWVHDFDAVYRSVGDHRIPEMTDDLMNAAAKRMMIRGDNFILVRPSRNWISVDEVKREADYRGYRFIVVRLTAPYAILLDRVLSRSNNSATRINSKESLDEYLTARPATDFPGERVIDTADTSAEMVAGRIVELVS